MAGRKPIGGAGAGASERDTSKGSDRSWPAAAGGVVPGPRGGKIVVACCCCFWFAVCACLCLLGGERKGKRVHPNAGEGGVSCQARASCEFSDRIVRAVATCLGPTDSVLASGWTSRVSRGVVHCAGLLVISY